MEKLMEKVMELIERDNLKSKNRAYEKVSKRFYLYYILRRNGMTLSLISKMFEKNHASVIHGIKVYKNRVEINDQADDYTLGRVQANNRRHRGGIP